MHRIVVVGAGTGGALTANLLVAELKTQIRKGDVSVQVVEARADHAFQPGNLDVAFRGADPADFLRPARSLLADTVEWIGEAATRIDVDDGVISLEGGRRLPFDHVVIATGAEARQDVLPGLKEASLTFHQGPERAAEIWKRLQSFEAGRIVVAITEVPYKCPPSPNEACFLLDEHFRKRGLRDDIELLLATPFPRAYPAEAISEQVQERFDEKQIGIEPFFMVANLDPDGQRLISMEGLEIPYDLLIAIPPHRGTALVRESGLGDAEGWIPTDKETMRVKHVEGAFALGDCTDLPISKSGVVAHLQAVVVVKNLLADLGLELGEWAYNGRINCPMEVGDHRLLWVQATYDEAPKKNRPSLVKYGMKKAFNKMYWRVLSGDLEWMFRRYFGPTAERRVERIPGDDVPDAETAGDAKEGDIVAATGSRD